MYVNVRYQYKADIHAYKSNRKHIQTIKVKHTHLKTVVSQ